MEASAQFCLRWNNYQRTIATSLDALRVDGDFVDVTLACDGCQLQAHRMVLSACSPFFRQLLKSNPHPHPIVILRDVSRCNMALLLDFMYHGQVNVAQEQLPEFLKVAELLKVKGLADDKRAEATAPPNGQSVVSTPPAADAVSPPGAPSGDEAPPGKRARQQAVSVPPLLPASPAPTPQYDPSVVKREVVESESSDCSAMGAGGDERTPAGVAAHEEGGPPQAVVTPQAEVTIEDADLSMPAEASRGHQVVAPGPSAVSYDTNVDPLSLVCREPGPSVPPPPPSPMLTPPQRLFGEPLQCCPHCPAVFSSKSTIKDHVARVHFPVPAQCALCGKLCANQGVLRVHRSRVHRQQLRGPDPDSPPRAGESPPPPPPWHAGYPPPY